MNSIDIIKTLKQQNSTLLLIPSILYNDILVDIPNEISSDNKICYVTLNKTYNSIKDLFTIEGISLDNVFFIDAITMSIGKADNTEKCYFVSSPQALTELSIVINEFLRYAFDYLIFDSLTTLLIYHRAEEPILKFLSNIGNKLKESGCRGLFYALDIKDHRVFIQEASMIADKVLNLGIEKIA